VELASGKNIILAFESLEECTKFGDILKAQQFFEPTVSICCYVFLCLDLGYEEPAIILTRVSLLLYSHRK
jgi:hypothetical protein